MKTLWIVNHHATTLDGSTAGARHAMLAERLWPHGWQTYILAGSSELHSGRQRMTGRKVAVTEEHGRSIFRWVRTYNHSGGALSRVASMVGFFVLVVLPATTRGLPRPDAVIGSSVHPLAAWAAWLLAKRYSVPFYFEIRDLWPETLIEMGAISRNGLAARLLRRLEQHLCNVSRIVITTMPYADEYLAHQGVPRNKVVWVSNGVEPQRFATSGVDAAEGGTFDFLYFGSLGHANALDVLIDAFASAFHANSLPNSRLRLIGQGPSLVQLRHLATTLGIADRVLFEAPVSRAEVPELAASANALVLCLRPLALYSYGISLNKLYEYMASCRPVVFAGEARGNPIVHRASGLVTTCTVADLANGLAAMRTEGRRERGEWAAEARRIVELEFSVSVLAEKLALTLNS